MKKIFLVAIAGVMAIGSFAAPNTDPKDCKKCTKTHCTKECKDKGHCTKGTCKKA